MKRKKRTVLEITIDDNGYSLTPHDSHLKKINFGGKFRYIFLKIIWFQLRMWLHIFFFLKKYFKEGHPNCSNN